MKIKLRGIMCCAVVVQAFLGTTARAKVEIVKDPFGINADRPTLIDIDISNATVKHAFDAVCQSSTVPVRVLVWDVDAKKRVSLKLHQVSFCEALLKVAIAAGV